MNIIELTTRLEYEGFYKRYYSFSRETPPLEGYIIEKSNIRWYVLFFERGETRDIANFESEYDACDFFYRKMKEDFIP